MLTTYIIRPYYVHQQTVLQICIWKVKTVSTQFQPHPHIMRPHNAKTPPCVHPECFAYIMSRRRVSWRGSQARFRLYVYFLCAYAAKVDWGQSLTLIGINLSLGGLNKLHPICRVSGTRVLISKLDISPVSPRDSCQVLRTTDIEIRNKYLHLFPP
jgi:hypothetical protein